MARFTVADCMEKIPNRFEMTLVAALRARELADMSLNTQLSQVENDKPIVLALREIAEQLVTKDILLNIE